MTVRKATSEEVVVKALASQVEPTSAEIATATGLGRSTVATTLAALERAGTARRSPGRREGRRRLPDRWSTGSSDKRAPGAGSSTQRLRPGQLDGLVLEFIDAQGKDVAVGATAVARALGRSAGAVGNCLTRLAAAGRVRQVSEKPRRYGYAATGSGKRGRKPRGARREES